MNSQVLHVVDLRSTLANLKYLFLYLTSTTSDMLPPPPVRARRGGEGIPIKRNLGVFDSPAGGSSAASSFSGNGSTTNFRMGIGKLFGNPVTSDV